MKHVKVNQVIKFKRSEIKPLNQQSLKVDLCIFHPTNSIKSFGYLLSDKEIYTRDELSV